MHLVDPRKTMKALYSQGDVVVFRQNAGQECVVMSLCGLIYHNMKGIGNPYESKQIMHIGSQLYSSLSQWSRQLFLLLTDLPSMLTVLEEDYQLEYSESYSPWWAYHWGISILYGPEKSFWVIDIKMIWVIYFNSWIYCCGY